MLSEIVHFTRQGSSQPERLFITTLTLKKPSTDAVKIFKEEIWVFLNWIDYRIKENKCVKLDFVTSFTKKRA